MTANAVKKAGHQVSDTRVWRWCMTSLCAMLMSRQILEWKPPCHMTSSSIHKGIINADSMPSIVDNIKLSREPFVPEVADRFPNGGPGTPISLHVYENLTLRLADYRVQYHQYWETTSKYTTTGRPVDVIIFPVGPHTATLPGKSYWWSKS